MGLPGGKKTATGAWSTSAGVLDDLAEQGNAFAARILDWRQLQKLKSTYTDALPRLSSIPRRTACILPLRWRRRRPAGSRRPNPICRTFRCATKRAARSARLSSRTPGHKLISADYSQIELRLLAHIADIPQLRQAFADGLDIHAMTASEMFGVPVEGMPGEVRRRAKAINFGIIYGISAFGLANQLGIPREEAGAYIKQYFERFPGIRAYMDATKKRAREQGYVTTIFGRKCHYPRINVVEPVGARLQRARGDQRADPGLRRRHHPPRHGADGRGARRRPGSRAQMLLQVHDELVFEAPDEEVEATIEVVRKVMDQAPHPAVQLRCRCRSRRAAPKLGRGALRRRAASDADFAIHIAMSLRTDAA